MATYLCFVFVLLVPGGGPPQVSPSSLEGTFSDGQMLQTSIAAHSQEIDHASNALPSDGLVQDVLWRSSESNEAAWRQWRRRKNHFPEAASVELQQCDWWVQAAARFRWLHDFFSDLRVDLQMAVFLGLCFCLAPVAGVGVVTAKLGAYMMPSHLERLRCASEAVLLCSLWNGGATSSVAIWAWLAWLLGCHCSVTSHCRATTWLVVCICQGDACAVRLVFLSLLAFLAPLYGKRDSAEGPAATSVPGPRRRKAAADNSENEAIAQSVRNLRRCSGTALGASNAVAANLAARFPFVPGLFMALLISCYSEAGLHKILSTERVQGLEIWFSGGKSLPYPHFHDFWCGQFENRRGCLGNVLLRGCFSNITPSRLGG